jgi:hypothetical protein
MSCGSFTPANDFGYFNFVDKKDASKPLEWDYFTFGKDLAKKKIKRKFCATLKNVLPRMFQENGRVLSQKIK